MKIRATLTALVIALIAVVAQAAKRLWIRPCALNAQS